MRLLLVSDDGQVVDSSDSFTLEEFTTAQQAPLGALALLQDLNAGAR